MIQRFSFGHPFPTQSVVLSLPAESGPVPFLTPDGSGWRFTLSEQAAVYGLGEMPRGINKRGWHYVADNTDESHHGENRLSYYGAHNFLLIDGGAGRSVFGVFVDFPGKVFYDIGYPRHDRVHNLYGGSMTRAAGEAFADLRPGRRTLLYSRSSIIGSHRYGGIWLGDNHSSWEQLLANIQMIPSVQMCGFLYTGADLCGFAGDTTPDLALRWLEFGLFTPLMRNHAAAGTREQEYFRFADQLPALREMLRLRYALLPYLYSEFMKSALENTGYFRPLGFDWPADPEAREVQDQLLLGDGVMLAPVYTQNAAGRHVYLPGPMQLYRLRNAEDYDTEALPAGHHYVRCALNEVLLFVRPGHAVPLAKPAACTAALDEQPIALLACPDADGHAAYRMYTDDGETMDPEHDGHWTVLDASH